MGKFNFYINYPIEDLKEKVNEKDKEIKNLKDEITVLQQKIDTISNDLIYINNAISKKEDDKQKGYLRIQDVDFKIGLNNKECVLPEGICLSKAVYLSYKDIKKKGCIYKGCQSFRWLDNSNMNYLVKSGKEIFKEALESNTIVVKNDNSYNICED